MSFLREFIEFGHHAGLDGFIDLDRHGARGHEIVHDVGVRGRGAEDVLQDRQFAEERDADGLFDVGLAFPAGEELFLSERERDGTGLRKPPRFSASSARRLEAR